MRHHSLKVGSVGRVLAVALTAAATAGALLLDQPKLPGDALGLREVAPAELCQRKGRIVAPLRARGLPLTRNRIIIDASDARILVTGPELSKPELAFVCQTSAHSLAATGQFEWRLTAQPTSGAVFDSLDTLTPRLIPQVEGQYVVQFTGRCPQSCGIVGFDNISIPAFTTVVTIDVVDELALPPETEPIAAPGELVPRANITEQEADDKCPGSIFPDTWHSPQLVTVDRFLGPENYRTIEGRAADTHIAGTDNNLNHHRNDFVTVVHPDPEHEGLLREIQPALGVEWETGVFREASRPTRSDRVSFTGYWVFDCHHAPIKTEIHPPVLSVAHRARAISVPPARGFGSNIYVPGIVSDIWANANGGEMTDNCSTTGLHSSGGDHRCLAGKGVSTSRIDHHYSFTIYLPKNPRRIVTEAGFPAPAVRVPLYCELDDPPGACDSDERLTIEQRGPDSEILDVRLNLDGYADTVYSRRIRTAWIYPSADNWGLRRWRIRVDSLEVHEDGDPDGTAGDWRFWINTNNGEQEWTKIFDCNNCVSQGTERFGGSPWQTGSLDRKRFLGPHLLLYPAQQIWVHASGYDDDMNKEDFVGQIDELRPQIEGAFSVRAACRPSGNSGCGLFTLNYEIMAGAAVGNAALTAPGRAIFNAFLVRAGDPRLPALPDMRATRDWNHPDDLMPRPASVAISLDSAGFFHPGGPEPMSFDQISNADFKRGLEQLRRERPAQLELVMTELQEELVSALNTKASADVIRELGEFKDAVPRDLWNRYLEDLTPREIRELDRLRQVYRILAVLVVLLAVALAAVIIRSRRAPSA